MTKNIDILSKLVELTELKIISFDIFDTLILRPSINPTDIFVFLDAYYDETFGSTDKKISSIRIDCENELIYKMGVENVTIDMIYEKLEKKIKLDKKDMQKLKEKEISIEIDLAILNKEILNVLQKANSVGKKIILASDMYLPSQYIAMILDKFHIRYDALYVSADLKKRKDKGDLYDEIICRENVLPSEILHIGDNENSDYLVPLKKGMLAFHCVAYHLRARSNFVHEFGQSGQNITSIFLGYLFSEENNLLNKRNKKFTNIYDFGYYSLGPLLLSLMLNLIFENKIQNQYKKIFFSSRDGYLPYRVYEELRKKIKCGIPGEYIYCGRRSLSISYYSNDAESYVLKVLSEMPKGVETKDVFAFLNLEEYYVERDDTKGGNVNYDKISAELEKKKKNAQRYFYDMLNFDDKAVVFDVGYSGSISDSILKLIGKKVDKIYLWETKKNKLRDKKNGTKTYCFFENYAEIVPFNLAFEELFSPLESACIFYEEAEDKICPVFDSAEAFNGQMKQDMLLIHAGVLDYVGKFLEFFGEYFHCFSSIDNLTVFKYTSNHFFDEKDESIHLFKNIKFLDIFTEVNIVDSLANKLCLYNRANSCKGNALINHDMLHINKCTELPNAFNLKIGMHIHMYYVDLYIDFIERLKEFPCPFDLYITISNKIYEKSLCSFFSSKIIPILKSVNVIVVENRGRDVAPWLIEMRNVHNQYDLFGHFHTKKSIEFGFATKWRSYLLDNLLQQHATIDILNLFFLNTNLGIVYPPLYRDIYHAFFSAGDSPFQEVTLVRKYLAEIGLPSIDNYNEIPFSAGTMFWYRPAALNRMFYDGLSYNDFPKEPVGVNGTLAHAIERLPSYIASIAGYTTKLYLNPFLVKKIFYSLFSNNEHERDYIKYKQLLVSKSYRAMLLLKRIAHRIGILALLGLVLHVRRKIIRLGRK